MERLLSNIVGIPVYEDDGHRPLTTVRDVIIDPESGVFLGVITNIGKNEIIAERDMLSLGEVIKIHGRDSIIPAEDVFRIDEVLKSGKRIFGNKVVTENGENLGKVFDLAIDKNTMALSKIFTAKGLLGLFRYDTRIISAKNIVEVLPHKIVIKGGTNLIMEKKEAKIPLEEAMS